MVRKQFVITDRQLVRIRKDAEEKGISQNEALRRLLDTILDMDNE